MATVRPADSRAPSRLAPAGRGPGCDPAALLCVNRCPISGCAARIGPERLMSSCAWYLVAKQLRDRIWATGRSGEGSFGSEHREAARPAVDAYEAVRSSHGA